MDKDIIIDDLKEEINKLKFNQKAFVEDIFKIKFLAQSLPSLMEGLVKLLEANIKLNDSKSPNKNAIVKYINKESARLIILYNQIINEYKDNNLVCIISDDPSKENANNYLYETLRLADKAFSYINTKLEKSESKSEGVKIKKTLLDCMVKAKSTKKKIYYRTKTDDLTNLYDSLSEVESLIQTLIDKKIIPEGTYVSIFLNHVYDAKSAALNWILSIKGFQNASDLNPRIQILPKEVT